MAVVQKRCLVIIDKTTKIRLRILEKFATGENLYKPKRGVVTIPPLLVKYLTPQKGDEFEVFFNEKGIVTGMNIYARKTRS